MTMGIIGGSLIVGAAGVYGANKAASAAEKAAGGDLPDWLRPYIKGAGDIPKHLTENPQINTNWMDYIKQLGEGGYDAPWQPMTADSPWFNQDQTFTPEAGGGPYGQLPPGMNAPPMMEQQQGPPQLTREMMLQMNSMGGKGVEFDGGGMGGGGPLSGFGEAPESAQTRNYLERMRGLL